MAKIPVDIQVGNWLVQETPSGGLKVRRVGAPGFVSVYTDGDCMEVYIKDDRSSIVTDSYARFEELRS